jgi:hypothetical protein
MSEWLDISEAGICGRANVAVWNSSIVWSFIAALATQFATATPSNAAHVQVVLGVDYAVSQILR